jgi:rubrerythrin
MCDTGSISESEAFKFAIKIEERMIEKNFLESFSSDYPGIQGVLDDLKGETQIHRDVLRTEYEKFKKDKKENENEAKIFFKYASTLGIHAEYERLLARLYSTFFKLFPEEKIWEILAEEEKKHEAWIKQIIMKVVQGTVSFNSANESDEYIINAVIGLKDTLNDIKIDSLKKSVTFEIAYNVENSMLEKEFFNKFSTDAPLIDNILKSLVKDTERHRDMLDKRIFNNDDL